MGKTEIRIKELAEELSASLIRIELLTDLVNVLSLAAQVQRSVVQTGAQTELSIPNVDASCSVVYIGGFGPAHCWGQPQQ